MCPKLFAEPVSFYFFFFNDTATTEIYTLSLHDALPICQTWLSSPFDLTPCAASQASFPLILLVNSTRSTSLPRSEEHTSELQSHSDLVCRLLLEKKKKKREDVNS